MVIIVHGMAEHGLRYAWFAEQLAAANLDVYAFDLRGHGATTPPVDHGHIGTATRWQTLIDDVQAVRSLALDTSGTLPTILFGHSLGSFIVQATVQGHGRDYAGAILSAPANPRRLTCWLGALIARIEAARVDPTGHSAILRAMTFGAYEKATKRRLGFRRTQFDWLSSSPKAVDSYIDDPQTGFDMRAVTWQCLFPGIARTQSPHMRRRAPANLPLLIGAGADDPVGRFGKGPRALVNSYVNNGQSDVTLRIYDGTRHELINDAASSTFVHDILLWLAKHELIKTLPPERPTTCDK